MSDPVRELFRGLHEVLPPGAPVTVTLPREWLAALVTESSAAPQAPQGVPMTVAEVGALLDRSPAAVRAWCAQGRLPGAFRLRGREWRIPRDVLDRFLAAQSEGGAAREPVDLSRWRSRRKAA